MQKYLNAIRTVVLICMAGKAVSTSFAGAEDGLPLSATINSLLINFLLLTLLYFSVEFAVRFFIWPQTRSIHAIAVFRKNKKTAVAKAEEPEPEPVKPVSPLETPKAKEVTAYTHGTFAGVLTNEELMALDKNLKDIEFEGFLPFIAFLALGLLSAFLISSIKCNLTLFFTHSKTHNSNL